LGDAGYQILDNGCHTAATDMANAKLAVAPLGINGPNLTVQTLENEVAAAYNKKCIA
jgi:hypothetical protein